MEEEKNYLILTFILFSFLVPEFKKPIGIMLTRGTLPKLRIISKQIEQKLVLLLDQMFAEQDFFSGF